MTPYRILWKSEEFQFFIAAAPTAPWHAAVLLSVHYGPSQIHYSLNNVIKLFPINQTSSKKIYDHIILE
jgi:hypothetical protein